MSRRNKSSAADGLMALVARMPWWAGVGLAAAFYLVFHYFASQPLATPAQPGQASAALMQSLWHAGASVAQYVLPILCLGGAVVSVWRRRERQSLVANVAQSAAADSLDGMTWQQFERLVGEAFRLQGYTVVERGGGGADGGIDLVLSKGGEKFLVQCKQWKAFKVGVEVVRELYGVMAASGAAGGFVITSGRFTEQATEFANGRNVKLIDGPEMHDLIRRVSLGRAADPAARVESASSAARGPAPDAALACPLCSKPMVKRTARRGGQAGAEFWGCTGYPSCKGARRMT